jgi:branched-chain amino acid transport system permease protein
MRTLPFRNELLALAGLLVAVPLLFPKHTPLGIYALGLVSGCSLALQAVGMILAYRSNRFINFAQVTLGGAAAGLFTVSANHLPSARWIQKVCPPCIDQVGSTYRSANYWVSLVLAIAISIALGWALYVLVVRRFDGAPRLVVSVATIFFSAGLPALMFQATQAMTTRGQREAGLHFDRAPLPFDLTISLRPIQLHLNDLLTVLAAALTVGGLWAYFRFSAVGTAIRASAENGSRAETLGVNVTKVTSRVWLIIGLLSGVGALLGATSSGIGNEAGFGLVGLLQMLVVAVIARFRSIPMAVLAAVVLGMVRQATVWSFGTSIPLDGSLVVLIGVILLLQGYRASRSDIEQANGWQAAKEARPIPRELRVLPTVKKWARVLMVIAGLALCLYPWLMSPAQTELGSAAMIYAIVGLSLLILTGWAGQISLGQFAFCGIGGYVAAVSGLPFPLALLAGSLVGAGAAVVVGLPALKLRGLHLAISTLAFAVAISSVLLNPSYLGDRLPPTLNRPALLGMRLDDPRTFYYFTLLVLVGVTVGVAGVRRSRTARVLIAARDNEQGIQSFGVNIVRARLTAFALSGFVAALAGAILAFQQHGVKATAFGPEQSVNTFLYTVIGGLGSIAGPIVGALYLWVLFIFGASPIVAQLATGFGGLLLLLAIPGGLAKVGFDVRDAFLRRVASRNRIIVASLVADRKAADVSGRAPIAPLLRSGGGSVFVPSRYELDEQWALGVTSSIVQAGAVVAAARSDDAEADGFSGLAAEEVGARD